MNEQETNNLELFHEYPDIMTVGQLRAVLGIGKVGVYKLVKSGAIRGFKLGNTYKIPKASLIEYIQTSCKGGVSDDR